MNTEERVAKQNELIEEVGLYFEDFNFSPIAGRVLALLMVPDKQQYTFDEIVEHLQISKSSASTALQILLLRKCIEYKTIAGSRKRYFQMKLHSSYNAVEDMEQKLLKMNHFITKVLELRVDPYSENSKQLKSLQKMTEILKKNIAHLKNEVDDNTI